MSTVAAFLWAVAARVREQRGYAASFVLSIVGTFLLGFLDLLVIVALFGQVASLAGWTASQVLLLYGISSVAYAVADFILGGLDSLPQVVRDGTFNTLLLRPGSVLLHVATQDFALRRVGRLVQASLVLAVIAASNPQVAHPIAWAYLLIVIAGASIIIGSLWVAASCLVLVTVDGGEFVNPFTSGVAFASQYPTPLFGDILGRLLVVIPVAWIAYLPLTVLLGKTDELGIPIELRLGSPAVAIICALAARAAWSRMLRYYSGAGS